MSAIAFPTPDPGILARRDEIIAGLAAILPADCLVTSEDERRAFETDALTAYRRLPLAVALPRTTQETAAVLRFCREAGVNVVPRGAGTSLAGGAIPQEDAIVIGLSKMNRILDVNYADRTVRVQAGVTNLSISEAVSPDGFFYAPDPSSQLACTIGGNIGMNSGGAHCLKYGVTTNNVLGVTLVTIDGDDRRDRRRGDGCGRARSAGPHRRLGRPAWHRDGSRRAHPARGGRRAAGAVRFRFQRGGRRLRGGHHRRGHHAGGDGIHGQARHRDLRGVREGGLSARCRSDADHRGRRLGERDGGRARAHRRDRQAARRARRQGIAIGAGDGADLEGPQVGVRRHGPRCRLHLHGRHGAHEPTCPTC